jgi:hypothetical protein
MHARVGQVPRIVIGLFVGAIGYHVLTQRDKSRDMVRYLLPTVSGLTYFQMFDIPCIDDKCAAR